MACAVKFHFSEHQEVHVSQLLMHFIVNLIYKLCIRCGTIASDAHQKAPRIHKRLN